MKIQSVTPAHAGGRVTMTLELAPVAHQTHVRTWGSKDGRVLVLYETTEEVMPPLVVIDHLEAMAVKMREQRAQLLASHPNAAGGIA